MQMFTITSAPSPVFIRLYFLREIPFLPKGVRNNFKDFTETRKISGEKRLYYPQRELQKYKSYVEPMSEDSTKQKYLYQNCSDYF